MRFGSVPVYWGVCPGTCFLCPVSKGCPGGSSNGPGIRGNVVPAQMDLPPAHQGVDPYNGLRKLRRPHRDMEEPRPNPRCSPHRPRNPRCPGIGAETPDPGQIGIPDFQNPGIPTKPGFPISRIPGSRPNRDSRFPESRDPDQTAGDSNPGKFRFFAATRTVIAHCQRQALLLQFVFGVPGWEKRLAVQ
jgi:hypothetical protein